MQKSRRGDSNPRPTHYECVALPTELQRLMCWRLRFGVVFFSLYHFPPTPFTKDLFINRPIRNDFDHRTRPELMTTLFPKSSRNIADPSKPAKKNNRVEQTCPGFPLLIHASRQGAEKIKGKVNHFGVWATSDAARDRFEREWPYLKVGRLCPGGRPENDCAIPKLYLDFLDSKKPSIDAI